MSMVIDDKPGPTIEESSRRSGARASFSVQAQGGAKCPRCGCPLSDYEVFACRIRGLKPLCLGCLASAVLFMRDELLPMLESALKSLDPRG